MKAESALPRLSIALVLGASLGLFPGLAPAQALPPPGIQWLPGEQLELAWPAPGDNMLLQAAAGLDGSWTLLFPDLELVGGQCRARLPMEGGRRFFRLRENPGNLIEVYDAMGIVLNNDNEPLPFAWAGCMGFSDNNGLIAGELPAGEWFTVHAEGHAPAPVQAISGNDGMAVFEAWLTRFPDQAMVAAGESHALLTDPSLATGLSVTFDGSQLASSPAHVGLAQIDLLDVGPRWAPLDADGDLVLTQAFALYASDAEGAPVQLAAGQQLAVQVRDAMAAEPAPVLARFDTGSGSWLALDAAACTRAAPDQLHCLLQDFAPLYGLFRPPPESLPEPGGNAASPASGNLDAEYKAANAAVSAALAEAIREKEEFGEVSAETQQLLLEAMANLATAAIASASANRDETGKMHLLAASKACELLDFHDLKEALDAELEDLTNELADDLAGNGDCGRMREMLKMLNQMLMLGGDPAIQSALVDKIDALANDCDLWTGTIRYFYWVDNNPPVGGEYNYAGGTPVWTEELHMTLATHPKTHQVTGEIAGMVRFPNAYYKTDSECEVSVEYSGLPGANAVNLQFGGTYDGITFALSDVTPASHSVPLSIKQYYVFKFKEDGECHHVDGASPNEIVFQDFFHSALVHGLAESPMITLQEMMENGTPGSFGEMQVIRGSEEFVAGEYAFAYPFTTGMVTWSFMHTKKVLPIEMP
jgi:hypothetical protein